MLGRVLLRSGRPADALAVFDDALSRPGLPAVWRARLRVWRGKTLAGTDGEAADREITEALADGERLADRMTVGFALQEQFRRADAHTGAVLVRRALDVIGDSAELVDLRVSLLTNLAYALEATGATAGARTAMREAAVVAERRCIWLLPTVQVQIAQADIDAGRWDDAWAELAGLPAALDPFERLLRCGGMALIAGHRDDRGTAGELLAEVRFLPGGSQYLRGNAGMLYQARAVHAEQTDGAAGAVAVYRDTLGPPDEIELYDRHQWLPDLVRLALAAGQPGLAADAVHAAEADAAVDPRPRRLAAARRARATLDGDVPALLDVARSYRDLGLLLALGHTYEDAAVLLARDGDVAGARSALVEAIRAYLELGASWDVRRADARMRPYGIRRGPRTGRRKATSGWAALTPTEQRVAGLVARDGPTRTSPRRCCCPGVPCRPTCRTSWRSWVSGRVSRSPARRRRPVTDPGVPAFPPARTRGAQSASLRTWAPRMVLGNTVQTGREGHLPATPWGGSHGRGNHRGRGSPSMVPAPEAFTHPPSHGAFSGRRTGHCAGTMT